ncbi:MAG: hypothetical protein JW753_06510 [Dehalococcoidia bacterium]|nr:hypothetical protein [Dehalococcoidia bacterium]
MSRLAFLQPAGIVRGIASAVLFCLTVAVLVSTPTDNPAIAWSGDPALNTVICDAGREQSSPVAVGDGCSGTIIVWEDCRNSNRDIYAQRMDPAGSALWTNNGVPVCATPSDRVSPAAVSDGHGGVIIAWQECTGSTGDIYAQRIDPAGKVLWTGSGVPVCTDPGSQVSPVLVSDGAGGAIVIWRDKRSSSDYDIYAQKIAASGTMQWTVNGVVICQAAFDQTSVTAVSDTQGGAIIAWQDKRRCGYDIYAQRVNECGAPQWTANGVCICGLAGHQIAPVTVEDGSGGAIIAWSDGRSATKYDVYGQRVDSAGAVQWTADGVPICTAPGDQVSLTAASDGAGGAIVGWQDKRCRTNHDIYSQRVDSFGNLQWASNGAPICIAAGDQRSPVMVSSGSEGVIIVWEDARGSGKQDIYGQSVDSAGRAQWDINGVPICTAGEDQTSPSAATDGSGGAIVTWQDKRNTTEDIYAQRVLASGTLCCPPNQPSNLSPAGGAEGVSLTPTLKCSAFSSAEPRDSHDASQWRVTATAGDYSNPVFDSGPDSFSLRQVTLEHSLLTGNTAYYWQVRHQGSNGLWSPWSDETSFITRNQPPDQPAGVWPENGTSGIDLTPTLQSSAFSDLDAGDTHAASQWRVTTTPGDYSSPVFLTPELTTSLIEVTIDSGCLTGNTAYHWQVRHQDNHGSWSDWSDEKSFTTLNRLPDQPAGIWPENDASGTSLTPMLQSSAFSDPDASDTHAASQWRITATSGDYVSLIFLTPELTSNLIQVTVDGGRLAGNTTYFWQVRHQDNHGGWSAWSEEMAFTTRNQPPDRPIGVSPEDGALGIGLTPTLQSSAFHDPDAGDTHAASQWRITTTPGDYSSPVFLTPEITSNLIQVVVDSGCLNGNTTYFWQVRHQDNHGEWSDWSVETGFTTLNRPPDRPSPVSPPSGTEGTSLSPTLESSTFSDPDGDDTHEASQWQVTTTAGDYSNPILDISHTVESSLTSMAITTVTLNPATTYYWRVRYQDNHGAWSEWSEEASFTTESTPPVITDNRPPDQPVCLTPEDGATGVSTSPTLEASAFHDPDADDSQAASQWQITAKPGDYQGHTFDGAASGNSITVSAGVLSPDTTYYWRVRYQDSHEAWSEWSEESSFTTEAEVPGDTDEETAMTSWIYLGAIVAVAALASAAVIWRNAHAARMATK